MGRTYEKYANPNPIGVSRKWGQRGRAPLTIFRIRPPRWFGAETVSALRADFHAISLSFTARGVLGRGSTPFVTRKMIVLPYYKTPPREKMQLLDHWKLRKRSGNLTTDCIVMSQTQAAQMLNLFFKLLSRRIRSRSGIISEAVTGYYQSK